LTASFTTQIEIDHSGVAWVGGTAVKVAEVVLDKIAYGWSPDAIHLQHPDLSLAQIHAALTYYYENQSVMDEQIRTGLAASTKLAAECSDPDFRAKLKNLKQPS
jgi:uncharacterized protein (DUF433 family)